jgi:hypothetical protein
MLGYASLPRRFTPGVREYGRELKVMPFNNQILVRTLRQEVAEAPELDRKI